MPLQNPSLPLPRPEIRILGSPIHPIGAPELRDTIIQWFKTDSPRFIITAGSLLLMEAQKNAKIKAACEAADLMVAESAGISWAARTKYNMTIERHPGIDLAYDLCSWAELESFPVYLLGGAPGVAKSAAKILQRHFPYLTISGMRDGFFKESDTDAIINDIRLSQSKVVLVALGMPRQEIWIHRHLSRLPAAVYMGVGGSFDVWAGRVKRAPSWMQKNGTEWFYRFLQEPWRLPRIMQLPKFAYKVVFSRGR